MNPKREIEIRVRVKILPSFTTLFDAETKAHGMNVRRPVGTVGLYAVLDGNDRGAVLLEGTELARALREQFFGLPGPEPGAGNDNAEGQ